MSIRSLGSLAAALNLAAPAAAQMPSIANPTTTAPPMMSSPAPAQAAGAPAGMFPTRAPTTTYGAAPAAPVYGHPAATAAVAGMPCGPAGCAPLDGCAVCDCLCGPPGRFWISAEYIGWVASGQRLPPLVTSAPAGVPRELAGVLGQPTTAILFGNQTVNDDWRSGFRLRAGTWLDECQRFGLEGDFFFLGTSRTSFAAGGDGSPGSPAITRPFFNVLQNRQDAQLVSFGGVPAIPDTQLVSFPGVLAGTVSVDAKSDFIGGGFNTICNICCDPCGRLDLLLGYRYLNLRDEVVIREDLTALAGSNAPVGTRFQITDRFRTNNNFHGANIGLNYERRIGHFFLGVRPSVALGVMNTTVTIDGSTIITPPGGASQVFPGGLLTQNSNIGRYTSDAFAVVPEIGVRLGVQVTNNMRAFVSYNYIYMSNVARAGDQIDLRVNTNQIAPPQPLNGPAFPAFDLRRTGYSVQGIGAGLEYRF